MWQGGREGGVCFLRWRMSPQNDKEAELATTGSQRPMVYNIGYSMSGGEG